MNQSFTIILARCLVSLCLVLGSTALFGQFTVSTSPLGNLGLTNYVPANSFLPGGMVSYYDFNHDGWDDLTVAGVGSNLMPQHPIFLINNEGTFEEAEIELEINLLTAVYALLWFDMENDGDADILITRKDSRIELWENDGEFNFTNIADVAGFYMSPSNYSSACIADYNHDGFLDVYVGKFSVSNGTGLSFENILYRNNGDGTFDNVTVESEIYLEPNPTMQPVWVDVNHDGWEDLFICVDRVPWSNELMLNDGDGTFTRVTTTAGVETYMDGMSSTVGDWNNDQDLDIFVTNSPIGTGNSFYDNQGNGTFVDIAGAQGVQMIKECWGAMWLDYDNDMYQDLFVTEIEGEGIHSFKNNAGQDLDSLAMWPINDETITQPFMLAAGDVNNDGYFDFSTNSWFPNNVQLFLNDGGDNHFISVTLEGTIANRDGIGTWIHCYAGGVHQVRYTHCGENYFGQDSRKEIFGLGTNAAVDSLVLEWNSGTQEVYVNPSIDTHHYFVEGASYSLPFDLEYSDDLFLCPGESVTLIAGDYGSYLWNTGDTTATITVSEPGVYSVEIVNQFGLTVSSNPVTIELAPENEVLMDVSQISCSGANDGAIDVSVLFGTIDSIFWNTGDEFTLLENLGPGIYSFDGIDSFGCSFNDATSLEAPTPLAGQSSTSDALCFGEASGSIEFEIIGGTPPYSPDWLGLDPQALEAGEYLIIVNDSNGCSLDMEFSIGQPDSLIYGLETLDASNGNSNGSATLELSGGTPPYSIQWSTGQSDTLSISGLAPGEYQVVIIDGNGCEETINFTISTNTGVEGLMNEHLNLYPNPGHGLLNVESAAGRIHWIELYDHTGRLVGHYAGNGSRSVLDLSNLSGGMYYLRASTTLGISGGMKVFILE